MESLSISFEHAHIITFDIKLDTSVEIDSKNSHFKRKKKPVKGGRFFNQSREITDWCNTMVTLWLTTEVLKSKHLR